MDLTQLPQNDPVSIYRTRDGLYAVDLLTAALTEALDHWTAAVPAEHHHSTRFGRGGRADLLNGGESSAP